jgi:putative phosphoesterase
MPAGGLMHPWMRQVGVISDTHGLLRPEALAALRDSALIIHAGDVENPAILAALGEIAPVFAVRGNVDRGGWANDLPANRIVEFEQHAIYVLHDLAELDLDPPSAGFRAVIYGHSHQPKIERKDGVIYFNPGSAGPKRFRLPICVGRLVCSGAELEPEIIDLGAALAGKR